MKWFVIVALVACSGKKEAPPAPAPVAPAPVAAPAPVVVDAAGVDAAAPVDAGQPAVVPTHGHSVVMPDKIKQQQHHQCPQCDFACIHPGERIKEGTDANGCPYCGCEKDPAFEKLLAPPVKK